MKTQYQKHLSMLKFLQTANLKQQKFVIKHLSDIQLKIVSELALNLLQGTIPLTDEEKRFLKKYAKLLRKLANKDVPKKKKLSIITRKLLLAIAKFALPFFT